MIKKIEIQGFQSHKDTVLDLCAGVNVVVGATDSGKSSIIRAFRWVTENRPLGDSFQSYWTTETRVSLYTETHKISRIKANKKDKYLIEYLDNSQEPMVLVAFGQQVPDEVLKVLNISSNNTQYQMDSSYLLSETAGTVAQHFNRLANIEQIDKSQKNIQGWMRSIKSDLHHHKSTQEDCATALDKYIGLDKLQMEQVVCSTNHNRLVSLYNRIGQLTKLISVIDTLQKQTIKWQEAVALRPAIDQIKEKTEDIDELCAEINNLVNWLNSYAEVEQVLSHTDKLEGLMKSFVVLHDINEGYTGISQQINKLVELSTMLYSLSGRIKKLEQVIQEKEEEFHELFPDKCPLCGKP